MRNLPPITITDAMITACNVVEAPPAAYAAGTTYALAATVSTGTVGGVISVWESLQNNNTGNSPATSPTWWKLTGSTYAEYDSGTTYALGDIMIVAATHKEYESLQAGNLNKAPATETTWWLQRGEANNRHKMFDTKVGSQTTNPDTITITLAPGRIIDSIAFLDVSATTIELTMTDPIEGVVYSETLDLVNRTLVSNWYTYFFEPIILQDKAILLGIPPYINATLAITISNVGGTAAIGTLAAGVQWYVGGTKFDADIRFKSYSRITEDDWGNVGISPGSFRDELDCEVNVRSAVVDETKRKLLALRDISSIWIGDDNYSAMIIYGFCAECSIKLKGPIKSTLSTSFKGLVY